MKITDHRLVSENSSEKISQHETSNQGGKITPRFIIIHFTAGRSVDSSTEWFKNSKSDASAHIVIGRDGKISQLIDFNVKAWHAGASRWAENVGFNNFSVGIELDNPGRLEKQGEKYVAWFGKEYPPENVVDAIHKHEDQISYWHNYTEKQIETCIEVCRILREQYPTITEILGHEDISPIRKSDPGPAFPMEEFRSGLLGRQDDTADIYKVTGDDVNSRKGAGISHEIITKLPQNTEVELIKSDKGWCYVFVAEQPTKNKDIFYGWIHNSLLKK